MSSQRYSPEFKEEAAQIDAPPLDALPDLIPAIMGCWRALVADFEG